MASYHTFTSGRGTDPDPLSLLTLLRAGDPTIGVRHDVGTNIYTLKRTTDGAWSIAEIAAAQAAIDTAPAFSASLRAQATILAWPIEQRAGFLAMLDQINQLRSLLPIPLAPITAGQMLAGIVNKAKTLSS
jgi:hypothetical protein